MSNRAPATAAARRSTTGLAFHTLATRSAVRVMALPASILVARALGPADRGRYALAITLVTVTAVLIEVGLEQRQLRAWSRRDLTADGFVTAAATFTVTLGLISAPAMVGAFLLLRESLLSGQALTDVLIVLAVPGLQLHSLLITGLLVMDGRLERVNRALAVSVAASLAATAGIYAAGELTLGAALGLYAGQFALNWVLLVASVRRVGRVRRPVPWKVMRRELTAGFRIYPYQIVMFLIFRIDVVIVAHLAGIAAAGQYAVAVTVAELVWLVGSSLAYPVVEQLAGPDAELAADRTMRAVRLSVLVSAGIAVAIGAGAAVAIGPLFGEGFEPARGAVWTLLPGMVAMVAWRTASGLLVRENDVGPMSWGSAAALALNVAANFVLVPPLGIAGAGIASSISYLLAAILAALSLRSRHGIAPGSLLPGRHELASVRALMSPSAIRRELTPRRAPDR